MAILTAVGGWYWYNQQLEPVASSGQEQPVTVKPGSSVQTVATQLEQQQLIRSSTAFDLYTRRAGVRSQLKAGTYLIKPTLSTPDIVQLLVDGETANRRLTVIPGDTLGRIRQRLLDEDYSQAQLKDLFNPENYQSSLIDNLPADASLEGYISPETYQTGYLQPPNGLIELGLGQMEEQLNQQILTGFEQQGLNVHQGLTLASIVEREATGDQLERRRIANVFFNRLEQGIRADITACFAAELMGEIDPGAGCTDVPLGIDSPYNTRLQTNTGLPPGPIGAPGEGALQAVANPTTEDFLFYFHDSDRIARFSTTNDEHEQKIEEFGVYDPS